MSDLEAGSIADLERAGSELSEVTRLVAALEGSRQFERTVAIGLAGNITTDLLGTYLRKQAILHGHRARILVGGFDDPFGSARQFVDASVDAVILLNLADAILPAFEARVSTLGRETIESLVENFRGQLALTLAELRDTRYVFVALPHRLTLPANDRSANGVDEAIGMINEAILGETRELENVTILSTGTIAARLGWEHAHDWRSYERFRAPFTPAFFDLLAEQVYRSTRGFASYFYKALVLDCDNTLWGGILGDDLAVGIKLGPHGYPGSVYWRVQHEFLALQRSGVLLCLCTKNDAADVESVLATHPEMVLRDEHFAAKYINWDDKTANLIRLAEDLNIGLDSLVFLDDSSFECEAVRSQLPMVRTIQVPRSLSDYPSLAASVKELFVPSVALDGASKTVQYRQIAEATRERSRYATQAEFLASLGLKVTLRRNERSSAGRIAELTQKTNQFNLTTRRYTFAEVSGFMNSDDVDVYSLNVSDRFGDAGLTGVVVTRYDEHETATIDLVLLSCRVLGRGIETAFWAPLLEVARARGCTILQAVYCPTPKNDQVRDFWDRLGLPLVSADEFGRRTYRANLATFSVLPASHIEVDDAV